jgi:hypothetical protein
MNVATVILYDAIGVFHTPETVDFLFVWSLAFLCRVSFENECIDVWIIGILLSVSLAIALEIQMSSYSLPSN